MKQSSSEEVRQLAKRSQKEELENKFLATWALLYPSLPQPERQVKFHPARKWAWDFSWDFEDIKLAVEIQGGTWMEKGGHTSGSGIDKDYEKWRAAVRLGWKVLPYSTTDMKNAVAVAEEVAEILCNAKEVKDAGDL